MKRSGGIFKDRIAIVKIAPVIPIKTMKVNTMLSVESNSLLSLISPTITPLLEESCNCLQDHTDTYQCPANQHNHVNLPAHEGVVFSESLHLFF